jgi:hypothetical protein
MKLGDGERAELAMMISDSLVGVDPNDSDEDSLREAVIRGDELKSGAVKGVGKDDFLSEARGCRSR